MLAPDDATRTTPSVAVVGAGAVGTVLAQRLAAHGYAIQAVFSRSVAAAQALATQVGAPVASTWLLDVPEGVRLVLLCVPDDAIAGVADDLAVLPHAWAECIVVHTSGALTTEVLAPLAERGARTLSLHPVQTFTSGTAPAALDGIYMSLEGTPEAQALGRRLVADLGGHPVSIAPEAKALYHLAASMASNFFVTLIALATEVLAEAGIDRPTGAALLRPLVAGTFQNLQQALPEDVLTGPIARGDAATVARQIAALSAQAPHLKPVVAAMMTETVRVAVQGGHLDPGQARTLLDIVYDIVASTDATSL